MKRFLHFLIFLIALFAVFSFAAYLYFDVMPAAAAADSNKGIHTAEEEPAENLTDSVADTSGEASELLPAEEEPAESLTDSVAETSRKASKLFTDFDMNEHKARLSKAYSDYDGVGKSAALPSFSPSKDDVIAVNCTVSDFVVRRSVEEAVVSAFAAEGIECLMVSDYSGGLLYKNLTDEEKDALLSAAARDGVKRYINIDKSSGIYGHSAITDAVFSFAIGRNEFSGAVSLESKAGYSIKGTYTSTLEMVSDVVGDLLVKEYLKYCD